MSANTSLAGSLELFIICPIPTVYSSFYWLTISMVSYHKLLLPVAIHTPSVEQLCKWLSWLIYWIFPFHIHCPAFLCSRHGPIKFYCGLFPCIFTITFFLTMLLGLGGSNLENKFLRVEEINWGEAQFLWDAYSHCIFLYDTCTPQVLST